jgi:hypothetical protein
MTFLFPYAVQIFLSPDVDPTLHEGRDAHRHLTQIVLAYELEFLIRFKNIHDA